MNKFFSVVGAIVVSILMVALTTFVEGVVLMNLWNWFIAPLGVMKIGYWMAFGVSLTLKIFINPTSGSKDDDDTGVWATFFGTIIGYLLIWGIGAIIVLFI